MVFAVALHLDLAQHDDVVVALHVLEGARQLLGRIGGVAGEPFLEGVDHAAGSVDDAFAAGVVPGPGDEGANRGHRFVARRLLHGFKINIGRADEGSVVSQSIHDG